jgi:hypothetical protein
VIDPTGSLIVELREAAGVAAIAGVRVRGYEPHGATDTYEGDSLGPGQYKAFVVIAALSMPPHRRVPVMWAEFSLKTYGRTKEEAIALYNACVDALHRQGPRLKANGLGIYNSWVTGGSQEKDPDTQQPYVLGTIQLTATTQAVAS